MAKPTLLGIAFDAGDVATARRLVAEVRREGPAAWKLETTLADLERSVQQRPDENEKAALATLLQGLGTLLVGQP